MSTNADPATVFLELFGRTRRSLSLVVWQALGPLDLGPKQVRLLRELAKSGAMSQAELARVTLTDPAATSRTLKSLAALRWVRRARSKSDEREITVELTASGRATARRLEKVYNRAAREVTATLEARDLADFRRVAEKVIERCATLRPDCRRKCAGPPPPAVRPRSRRRGA